LQCSSSRAVPPGFNTLFTSLSAAAGSLMTHRLKVSTTVSKEASGKGRAVASACNSLMWLEGADDGADGREEDADDGEMTLLLLLLLLWMLVTVVLLMEVDEG
jgi:hypothetical protein